MAAISIDKAPKHHLFSMGQLMEASANDWGFCLACGDTTEGCEPDMRRGTCDGCGKRAVYGAEEALLMGRIV